MVAVGDKIYLVIRNYGSDAGVWETIEGQPYADETAAELAALKLNESLLEEDKKSTGYYVEKLIVQ
jgi:hypothetical protein